MYRKSRHFSYDVKFLTVFGRFAYAEYLRKVHEQNTGLGRKDVRCVQRDAAGKVSVLK
jgi:hypothetical protein